VCVETNTVFTLTLKDVPNLRLNIVFVHALDLAKFHNNFGDGKWKLTKGSFMVARGVVYSMLYKTQFKLIKHSLNAFENYVFPNLWHKRMAHLSEKGL